MDEELEGLELENELIDYYYDLHQEQKALDECERKENGEI